MSETPSKKETAMVEFVPFGGDSAIKLSVAMVKTMIAVPTKTGKLPSDNDCIKFIALCQARRLNPFEGDAFMVGYDTKDGPKFNLITSIQAFLKRAEANKDYDGMKSGVIVEREDKIIEVEGDFHLPSDKVAGGWATVFRKGQSNPITKRIRLSRFRKEFGVWVDDPAGMICKCAEADALRTSFPTMLGGMFTREEMPDPSQEPKMTKPLFESKVTVDPPAPATVVPITAEDIKDLCKRDGINEHDLIGFAVSIALCEDDCNSLEHLPEDSIRTIFDQWGDFAPRIKEAIENQ